MQAVESDAVHSLLMTTGLPRQKAGVEWQGDTLPARCFLSYCRTFPQHRGKTHVCNFLASLLFRGSLPVRNHSGARLRVDPVDWIGRQIAFQRGYEPHSLGLAREIMKNGGIFVDIGCNFGLYTFTVGYDPQC